MIDLAVDFYKELKSEKRKYFYLDSDFGDTGDKLGVVDREDLEKRFSEEEIKRYCF
jgi:hypothetical protein